MDTSVGRTAALRLTVIRGDVTTHLTTTGPGTSDGTGDDPVRRDPVGRFECLLFEVA
jgi:hypothetical protein